MSEESSSYLDLDYDVANEPPEKNEQEIPKRKIVAWSMLGVVEFLLAVFAIAYVSFTAQQGPLALWLQIYGVTDAAIVLVEAWLMVRVALSCNVKLILVEMAVTVTAILFFLVWWIAGVVLLLRTPSEELLWNFSLIMILYQLLRGVIVYGFERL
jgi:hypothetical protein